MWRYPALCLSSDRTSSDCIRVGLLLSLLLIQRCRSRRTCDYIFYFAKVLSKNDVVQYIYIDIFTLNFYIDRIPQLAEYYIWKRHIACWSGSPLLIIPASFQAVGTQEVNVYKSLTEFRYSHHKESR